MQYSRIFLPLQTLSVPNTRARARPEAGRGALLGGGGSLSWLAAKGGEPGIAVQVPQSLRPTEADGIWPILASVQSNVIDGGAHHTRSFVINTCTSAHLQVPPL